MRGDLAWEDSDKQQRHWRRRWPSWRFQPRLKPGITAMGSAATDLVATVSVDTAGLEAAILPATSVVMAGMADIAATDGAGVVFIRPSASTPTLTMMITPTTTIPIMMMMSTTTITVVLTGAISAEASAGRSRTSRPRKRFGLQ